MNAIKDTEIQKWKDLLAENEKLLAALREESGAQRTDHDLVMKEQQASLGDKIKQLEEQLACREKKINE